MGEAHQEQLKVLRKNVIKKNIKHEELIRKHTILERTDANKNYIRSVNRQIGSYELNEVLDE